MTRKMVRDDPDEKMGDVQEREVLSDKSRNQNDSLLVCLAPVKPKSETKPIQYVASKTKKIVLVRKVPLPGSEMSRYPGRLLPRFAQGIKQFFVIIRYKECQKN